MPEQYIKLTTPDNGVANTTNPLASPADYFEATFTAPAGTAYTTLEIKVNFVRPVVEKTGLLRCRGEVINLGRRVATAQASITDRDGKLYGHASTTCLIFPIEEGI